MANFKNEFYGLMLRVHEKGNRQAISILGKNATLPYYMVMFL